MEIVIVWSWFSFILGIVSALVGSFVVLFILAYKNWSNQKKQAAKSSDSIEKMFAAWGGRHNE